jgi:subtilisin family serine protease
MQAAVAAVFVLVLLPFSPVARPAAASARELPPRIQTTSNAAQEEVIADSYIVVLRNDVIGAASLTESVKKSGNVKVDHEYNSAFRGFSAEMTEAEALKLENDPRVAFVEPNRKIYRAGAALDYGQDRVNADLNPYAHIDNVDTISHRVNVDIAIIDDGVGPHPLLNVYQGFDCTGSGSWNGSATNSHGTFVAGLAAGIDNSAGYPGVAPGARIWSVKVINGSSGNTANLLCGLNYVYANRTSIEVANMSLGAYCPFSDSICGTVGVHNVIAQLNAAGVTMVVAAGNETDDASKYMPAKYSEVITVSALADSDAMPGGFGPPTFYEQGNDDTFATFSNYGSVVDIAAPGVDLISLYPGSGYTAGSGTSFSSPIVAGAAALYIAEKGDVGPAAVKSGLLSRREKVHLAGDHDSIDEGVLNASGRNLATLALSRSSAQVDMEVVLALDNFDANESVNVRFDKTIIATTTVNASGDGWVSVHVPAGVKGNHIFTASSHDFSIDKTLSNSPRIRLSPTSGIPGSSFNVSLRGFMKQQTVAIKWYNGSSYVTMGTVKTSNTGSANKDFVVPTTYRGGHKVEADPPVGGSVSTTFAVKPRFKIVPGSGASGSTASIELKGFVAGETVKVYFFNGATKILLRTKTASSTGSATSTVTIPASATISAHTIQAEGTGGSLALTSFSVTSIGGSASTATPTATLNPTETVTPEPVATESPTPAPVEETPTAEVTEAPTETATETATPTPTAEPIVEDSGTPGP